MIAPLKAAALALGVVLAGSLDWDPHFLVATWPDGHTERVPATTGASCNAAVAALYKGFWHLDDKAHGGAPVSASCVAGDGFTPADLCIAHLNCRARR